MATMKTRNKVTVLPEPDNPKPIVLEPRKVLTKAEQERLTQLEAVVKKQWNAFFEVIFALYTIKQEDLWRADYDSWEDYVEKKWRISRQHSYRLIQPAEFLERIRTVTQGDTTSREEWIEANATWLPRNERAYRMVGELLDKDTDPKKAADLLKAAAKRAEGKSDIEPAAIRITAVAMKLVAKPKKAEIELKTRWEGIRDGLQKVMEELGKGKRLKPQVEQLQQLLKQVREAIANCPKPAKPAAKPGRGKSVSNAAKSTKPARRKKP